MRRDDIPIEKLEAALTYGPPVFVAGSSDALEFWTDDEYTAHFGFPKPTTREAFAEVTWRELALFLEEDYESTGRTRLVNLPGVPENRERLAAWAAKQPEIKQLRGDTSGLMFLYDGDPDQMFHLADAPGVLYTRAGDA